jgi:hypothetical protein
VLPLFHFQFLLLSLPSSARETCLIIISNDLCLRGHVPRGLARIIAAVKNIDAPMLTRVWKELEYRIDVCRVTRGAHIENSSCQKKF